MFFYEAPGFACMMDDTRESPCKSTMWMSTGSPRKFVQPSDSIQPQFYQARKKRIRCPHQTNAISNYQISQITSTNLSDPCRLLWISPEMLLWLPGQEKALNLLVLVFLSQVWGKATLIHLSDDPQTTDVTARLTSCYKILWNSITCYHEIRKIKK